MSKRRPRKYGWKKYRSGLAAFTLAAVGLTTCESAIPSAQAAESLQPFATCEGFLQHIQTETAQRVGPYGLADVSGGGFPLAIPEEAIVLNETETSGQTTRDSSSKSNEDADFSGTNVQEAGIDEPDIVKTDGKRILVITGNNQLIYVDTANGTPVQRGMLKLDWGWNHQLFFHKDQALLLSQTHHYPREAKPDSPDSGQGRDESRSTRMPLGTASTVLTAVDLSDPDHLAITRKLHIEGSLLTARRHEEIARVIVQSPPRLHFSAPSSQEGPDVTAAIARNQEIIRASTVDDWLPHITIETPRGSGSEHTTRLAVDCDDVMHPPEYSGASALTVLAIDLEKDLEPHHSSAILATGNIVYASPNNLYVASNPWREIPRPFEESDIPSLPSPEETPTLFTRLHQFNISQPDDTIYRASGKVSGRLLNQFALSEHENVLRVATTVDDFTRDSTQEPVSFVTSFKQKGDFLQQIGQVGGLGRGERIHSVRFLGDTGYVVTFRRTDPLYTIDLSDPTKPKVTGELKIEGYSAYLHPIDSDNLIGVGQDATLEGRTIGTQVSLFDVSDPSQPRRTAKYTMGKGTNSEIEYDHKAFLYWAASDMTVIPFTSYRAMPRPMEKPIIAHTETEEPLEKLTPSSSPPEQTGDIPPFHLVAGAIALNVNPDTGISERATLLHPQGHYFSGIRRSLVIGDVLYTVSDTGIMGNDLKELRQVSWVTFSP